MSRQRPFQPAPSAPSAPVKAPSLSDSVIVGNMRFAGMVRTANGVAVAHVELTSDGKLVKMSVGPSQEYPQFGIAQRALADQSAIAQWVLKQPRRP